MMTDLPNWTYLLLLATGLDDATANHASIRARGDYAPDAGVANVVLEKIGDPRLPDLPVLEDREGYRWLVVDATHWLLYSLEDCVFQFLHSGWIKDLRLTGKTWWDYE